jgi:hypothetical protein
LLLLNILNDGVADEADGVVDDVDGIVGPR